MPQPTAAAVPLPCPACRSRLVRGVRAERFALWLEPARDGRHAITDRAVPLERGETRLQFECDACRTRWRSVKAFERALEDAGIPVAPVFG